MDSNQENFFDEVPFGVVECTCEKYPKFKYINRAMLNEAGAEGLNELSGLLGESIYLLVPFDTRNYIEKKLKEADSCDRPVALRHEISGRTVKGIMIKGCVYRLRADKEEDDRYIFTYVRDTTVNQNVDVTEHSYFRALESAYNIIFEIDLRKNTVDCIYGRETSRIGATYDITMTIDSAMPYWVNNYIVPQDRAMALDFFHRIIDLDELNTAGRPLQMQVALEMGDGSIEHYIAVAVQVKSYDVLLCCRNVTSVKYLDKSSIARTTASDKIVFARTFGHFDLFVDEKPVVFSGEKEKELLAILIDRNGGTVTAESAMSYLWEEEPMSENLRVAYRKLAMGLKNTLTQYGVEDIIVNKRGVRSIDTSKIVCDYYETLRGNEKYSSLFSGQYMVDYSWAEETLGLLINIT